MSVELSAFLNSSNDHNKLPKQAEWLSFDYFFESIWEAKAQEKHNTRPNCEGQKPFLKECSSQRRLIVLLNLYWFLLWQCLILADTFWGTRIHITELKPLPHRHLISYRHSGPCPDCGSVHQATLHIGQALKLGLSAFPFSCRRGDSETSGANARHLWLVLSCSPLLFYSSFKDFCTQTMSSALGFFSSWTAESFNDISDELDLSWKAQVNQVRRITATMASCQMLHICSKLCPLELQDPTSELCSTPPLWCNSPRH